MAPDSRNRFIFHRATLRRILAGHLACKPAEISFSYSRLGRPSLVNPGAGIDFNLSHSGDDAVLAVSTIGAVGVDIEKLRSLPDYTAVARRVWPAAWVTRLLEQPPADRQRMFFHLWTRFEACQKAAGSGVFSAPSGSERPSLPFLVHQNCIGHLCLADPVESFPDVTWLRLADHD